MCNCVYYGMSVPVPVSFASQTHADIQRRERGEAKRFRRSVDMLGDSQLTMRKPAHDCAMSGVT